MAIWPEVMLGATIPIVLAAGKRVLASLVVAVKAKRALEDEVLRIARAEPGARAALEGVAHDDVEVAEATKLLDRGAARLKPEYATPVRHALAQTAHGGHVNYVRDVARHVDARLSATM